LLTNVVYILTIDQEILTIQYNHLNDKTSVELHPVSLPLFRNLTFAPQTTRGDFDSSEYEVRRRYQDFLWLKGKLEEAHPTLIIHVGRSYTSDL